ncbi:tRNA methyltransferase [Fragilaria crotonensis]|nr:tRNA methyltransferase [Fragilaria crotonensis]
MTHDNQARVEEDSRSLSIPALNPATRISRSLLPHEPLPNHESSGFLHVQGSFEFKKAKKKEDKANSGDASVNISGGDVTSASHLCWTRESFHQALSSSPVIQKAQGLVSIQLLDKEPPFTKVRLVFDSPENASTTLHIWRRQQLSAHDVLSSPSCSQSFMSESQKLLLQHSKLSTRQLQITQITYQPMLPTHLAWTRSNPPKFRRILRTDNDAISSLEEERADARFVFITNLLPVNNDNESLPNPWPDSHAAIAAIRTLVDPFDSTGYGVEVFIPHASSSTKSSHWEYCHVGMRIPSDAQRLIRDLQGVSVPWSLAGTTPGTDTTCVVQSPPLFLDYATVTPQSAARSRRTDGLLQPTSVPRGEPSRAECTSTTESVQVPGLLLLEDFVSIEEEQVLMAVLHGPQAPWAPSQTTPSQTGAVKRRVQHYGYVFDYETADVLRDKSSPGAACPPMPAIPKDVAVTETQLSDYMESVVQEGRGWEALAGVLERTRQHVFEGGRRFPHINQMTINEYRPGEGIGSHIDTPSAFGDGLMSLSLNSGIVMEFRDTKSDQTKLVYLPARSLLVMTGPARYEWEHHIVTRRTDTHKGVVMPRGLRVSLTLRTALNLPDRGGAEPLERVESNVFPPVWGTGSTAASDNVLQTPETERQHVHAVYDAVATQWHHTRGKRGVLWPGATRFLQELPKGSVVADIGCGDGKYFPAIWEAGSYVIGTDISLPLLQTCNFGTESAETRQVSPHRLQLRNRPAVAVADCLMLPLKSKSVDAAICIAVLHHLSTIERRLRCIQELVRIVQPGGLINIQAWAMEQDEGNRRKFASSDVFVPFNAQPKYLDKAQSLSVAPESDGTSLNEISSVAQLYAQTYKGAEYNERKGLVIFQRYCHLYRQGELESLAAQIKGVELVECGYESGNHFMILHVLPCEE